MTLKTGDARIKAEHDWIVRQREEIKRHEKWLSEYPIRKANQRDDFL